MRSVQNNSTFKASSTNLFLNGMLVICISFCEIANGFCNSTKLLLTFRRHEKVNSCEHWESHSL